MQGSWASVARWQPPPMCAPLEFAALEAPDPTRSCLWPPTPAGLFSWPIHNVPGPQPPKLSRLQMLSPAGEAWRAAAMGQTFWVLVSSWLSISDVFPKVCPTSSSLQQARKVDLPSFALKLWWEPFVSLLVFSPVVILLGATALQAHTARKAYTFFSYHTSAIQTVIFCKWSQLILQFS